MLLIFGGLFLRSMQYSGRADLGFDRAGILMFGVDLGLEGYGLEVVERVPIEMPATERNRSYLATKRDKMGHLLTLPQPGQAKRRAARAVTPKGKKR